MRNLRVLVLLALTVAALAGERRGSLRGALRALERRRRAPAGVSLAQYRYPSSLGEVAYLGAGRAADYRAEDAPVFLDQREHERPHSEARLYIDRDDDYPSPEEFDVDLKGTSFRERNKMVNEKKRSSPFRERTGKWTAQAEKLKELYLRELAAEEEEQRVEEEVMEAERKNKPYFDEFVESLEGDRPEVVDFPENKLFYKDVKIRKRQVPGEYSPTGWGPVAFKRKRSSNQRLDTPDAPNDFLYSLKFVSQGDPSAVENLKDEKGVDEEEDSDVSTMIQNRERDPRVSAFNLPQQKPSYTRDEYMLALQPLNNPPTEDLAEEEGDYIYENAKEKRFPVSKRSSFSAPSSAYRQRFAKRNLRNGSNKMYRSLGTDPRVIKELTSIFGNQDSGISKNNMISKPVKRSSPSEDTSHESKPPSVTALSHHESNDSHEDHSHGHDDRHQEHHEHDSDQPHSRHEHENKPPLLSSNGHDHSHENEENKEIDFKDDAETHIKLEHPIILKKKSIDWSNYFGIDKRKKKSVNTDLLHDSYLNNARRYMNSMSLKNFRTHEQPQGLSENDFKFENTFEEKRDPKKIDQIKLDSMDNKLKNMETAIVDEALQYSESNDGLDTKEEQEVKEKILSRLAAAYSLEKMRKAIKEFKMSLIAQRNAMKDVPQINYDDDKEKRNLLKEKLEKKPSAIVLNDNKLTRDNESAREKTDEDFESEQGAGHFLNGPEAMSEGYMGGSGMKNKPNHVDSNEGGSCPILDRIVRRCQRSDILAGDHGFLFLPLCSYHQICYLCGPSSPTNCDLIFLSEADSVCGGRAACLEAARASVMSLREAHDELADDLEGECSRGSCLAQALDTDNWQHPFKR